MIKVSNHLKQVLLETHGKFTKESFHLKQNQRNLVTNHPGTGERPMKHAASVIQSEHSNRCSRIGFAFLFCAIPVCRGHMIALIWKRRRRSFRRTRDCGSVSQGLFLRTLLLRHLLHIFRDRGGTITVNFTLFRFPFLAKKCYVPGRLCYSSEKFFFPKLAFLVICRKSNCCLSQQWQSPTEIKRKSRSTLEHNEHGNKYACPLTFLNVCFYSCASFPSILSSTRAIVPREKTMQAPV